MLENGGFLGFIAEVNSLFLVGFDSRGLICRIYVGYYWTLLHTKYMSSAPHGFNEDF